MPNVAFFFGFLNFLILTVSGFLLFLFWELLKEKKDLGFLQVECCSTFCPRRRFFDDLKFCGD